MLLKDGADITGVQWQMFHAALVAELVFKRFGAEAVITAGIDGKHMKDSLHYKGLALDFRTFNVSGREMAVQRELKRCLGPEYDIVLEKDHIHVEFDPKG